MTFLIVFCAVSLLIFLFIVWPICIISGRCSRREEANVAEWKRQNRIDGQRKWDTRLGRYE